MKYQYFTLVCLVIHALINIDIFRKKPTVNLPAIKAYRVFLTSTAAYFVDEILWGIFLEYKLPMPLYVTTVINFLIMGFTILAWTRYVVQYLQSTKWFGRTMLYVGNAFFLAEVVLLIVNIFQPIFFAVDWNTSEYIPGRARRIMLYVQFIFYLLLGVYTALYAFRQRGTFRRKNMTICLYSIIMGAALAVQVYFHTSPIYSIGCIVGSTMLNAFLITDIKEEYKTALEQSRVEVKQNQSELAETKIIAYSDPLTGVKNKHAYVEEEERIDKAIAKNEMGDFAVIVFDLNGLKVINDTKGHEAGDLYLIEATKVISRYFGNDTLYRFGGDEFVVIVEDARAYKERQRALYEFERFIDSCLDKEGAPIISSGMSKYRKGQDNTYHAVFIRADKIMYARKDALKEHRA